MKSLKILLILLIIFGIRAEAQYGKGLGIPDGHSWIDYSKSYVKIKVSSEGMCRIKLSDLSSAGMATVKGSEIQLFRYGKEVPIFVSTNANFGSNDYLEFYAHLHDGEMDRFLYMDSTAIPNPDHSLISDTGIYYLTTSSGSHLRYNNITSNIGVTNPSSDYVYQKIDLTGSTFTQYPKVTNDAAHEYTSAGNYYKGVCNNLVFSRNYRNQNPSKNTSFTHTSAAPNAPVYLKFNYSPLFDNTQFRPFSVKAILNSTIVIDTNFSFPSVFDYNFYQLLNIEKQVSSSALSNGNNVLKFSLSNTFFHVNSTRKIEWAIPFAEIYAPTLTNSLNGSNIEFYTPISSSAGTLRFTGLSANSSYAVYDPETRTRTVVSTNASGDVMVPFAASSEMKQKLLIKTNGTNAISPILSSSKTFENIASNINVNYIIITHEKYLNDPTAAGYVNDYKNYRQSSNGGSYKAEVYDYKDIVENFGYGNTNHPLAIKSFLKYANETFNCGDSLHCLILCKGVSPFEAEAHDPAATPNLNFPVIANYSVPGSDFMFGDFDYNVTPDVAIGRVGVRNADDINVYLSKVMEYESAQKYPVSPTVENYIKGKEIIHLIGISPQEIGVQNLVKNEMRVAEENLEDLHMQGHVRTFVKASTSLSEQLDPVLEDSLLKIQGVNIVGFYGHSSTSNFDFNMSPPEDLNNAGKYFNFFAMGCTAGNQYLLDPIRALSERHIFQPNAAAITFSGTSSNGWTDVLGKMYQSISKHISTVNWGQTIGQITKNSLTEVGLNGLNRMNYRTHLEQWNISGDPAIRFNITNLPDFDIESKYIFTDPKVIDGSIQHIKGVARVYNLAKGSLDSFTVEISKVTSKGNVEILTSTKTAVVGAIFTEIPFEFDVDVINEIGINKIVVKVDPNNEIQEMSEMNNEAEISYNLISADAVPAFPYEFAIVNYDPVKLKAYTLDPVAPNLDYYMELDTTEYFNSPLLKKTVINSDGGLLEWDPNLKMTDSTVYYWRVRPDTIASSGKSRWKSSSFVYLPNSSTGWNQSHYFQYLKNSLINLEIDSSQRFKFGDQVNSIDITVANLYGPVFNISYDNCNFTIGGGYEYNFSCKPIDNIHFIVVDTLTGRPWINDVVSPNTLDGGLYNSLKPCRRSVEAMFAFAVNTPTERKQAMDFIDSIPDGYYVAAYNVMMLRNLFGFTRNETYVNEMMADTTLYGSGNSLYHKLKGIGFSKIDSFYKNRPFALFTRKNTPSFNTQQVFGADSTEIINASFVYNFAQPFGSMISTEIGPSYEWIEEHWRGEDLNPSYPTDSVNVSIFGINSANQGSLLKSALPNDTSIQFISHLDYPLIQLQMDLSDDSNRTANQNHYWRVNFEESPDLALAPNLSTYKVDTVYQGEDIHLNVAVKNISRTEVKDSIEVLLTITDRSGNSTLMRDKYSPLKPDSSFVTDFIVKTDASSGNHNYSLTVNPNVDFIEKTYLNNSMNSNFYVSSDNQHPLLDVTFDDIHIINDDIVSAKPNIKIEVKDENKFQLLNDTALFDFKVSKVELGSKKDIGLNFSSSKVIFTPATTSENVALIELMPELEDGTYILDFNAKDQSGNTSRIQYSVQFQVIGKSTISNVVNYPNPFTTSTRFVFTLTGSELPDNMMIQIYTVSGKLIKEIKYSELGQIHIGTNITDYAWDGTDQYGDPVANGVYYYRMKAKLNNNDIIHRNTSMDKGFVWGVGKMYILR